MGHAIIWLREKLFYQMGLSNCKLIRELIFCGLLAVVKSAAAQSEEDFIDTNFRVKLDYVAISSVFNQQNIRATQDSGVISYQPLETFSNWRALRRTRLVTVPFNRFVKFKDKRLDGDSGTYKNKILRVRGRLVTATDRGVWIYQHRQQQVVYVPYKKTKWISSGSRMIHISYAAKSIGRFVWSVVVLVISRETIPAFGKPKNPIYEVYIQAEEDMGLYYKHLAEGGRVHEMSKFDQMFLYRNVNLYFKEYVRRTSVPVKKFLPTSQILPFTQYTE